MYTATIASSVTGVTDDSGPKDAVITIEIKSSGYQVWKTTSKVQSGCTVSGTDRTDTSNCGASNSAACNTKSNCEATGTGGTTWTQGYKNGDTITVLGTALNGGATPANDLVLTVTGIDSDGLLNNGKNNLVVTSGNAVIVIVFLHRHRHCHRHRCRHAQ